MAAPQVLVAGAGVVGLSCAYYLSSRGLGVEIIEAGPFPSPTTAASLGVLTHFNGGADPYSTLYRDGHALYAGLAAQLREETGIDIGWRPLGGIDLAFSEEEAQEARQLLRFNQERHCPAEWLTAADLRRLEPRLSARAQAGVYFPMDHRVAPEQLARALLKGAQQRGAHLRCGEPVEGFAQLGDGVQVQTRTGVRQAEFLVLAAGSWTGELGQRGGAEIPVRPVRGQHGCFAGGAELRHVLRWAGFHLVPSWDQIIAGATVEEVGFALETTAEAASRFEEFFCQVLDLPPVRRGVRAGLRPKPRGGRPLIGPLQSQPRIFVAAGHYKNGILLGPLTGQILGEWIGTGQPPRDMSAFAVER